MTTRLRLAVLFALVAVIIAAAALVDANYFRGPLIRFIQARTGRNIAMFVGLLAFVIIVFVVTIARLGGNVASNGF